MRKVKTRTKVVLDDYVNKETGELLVSELNKDTSIFIEKETDLMVIDSEEYFIADIKALNFLRDNKILTGREILHLMVISTTLKTVYNAAFNHTVPHTLETLSTLLCINYENTSRLVKKLQEKNVLYRLVTAYNTYYCVNPYLTRRRKTVSKELDPIFNKFFKSKKTAGVKLED